MYLFGIYCLRICDWVAEKFTLGSPVKQEIDYDKLSFFNFLILRRTEGRIAFGFFSVVVVVSQDNVVDALLKQLCRICLLTHLCFRAFLNVVSVLNYMGVKCFLLRLLLSQFQIRSVGPQRIEMFCFFHLGSGIALCSHSRPT